MNFSIPSSSMPSFSHTFLKVRETLLSRCWRMPSTRSALLEVMPCCQAYLEGETPFQSAHCIGGGATRVSRPWAISGLRTNAALKGAHRDSPDMMSNDLLGRSRSLSPLCCFSPTVPPLSS